MDNVSRAATKAPWTSRISPLFLLVCGFVMMLAAGLFHWLEPRSTPPAPAAMSEQESAQLASQRSLQRAREREAQARADEERRSAEEAASRRLRVSMEADAASEAAARRQREELVQRRADSEQMQRATADNENAWKRFYKPSENCRDPANTATVACVNEYMKARRTFQGAAAN